MPTELGEGFRVEVARGGAPLVLEAEAALDVKGFPIPLPSRAAWGRLFGGRSHRQALAIDPAGGYGATLGFSLTSTRALPGHQVLRLEAVGDAYASAAGRALVAYAARYARQRSRILRVVVELECREEFAREALRASLRESGFVPGIAERVAPQTLALDLSPEEPALFAGLGRTTRQNIRNAVKHDLQLEQLTDPRLADRMNGLLGASLARTGGSAEPVEWEAFMRLSADLPQRSHLVGAFLGRERTAGALVGFGLCLHHGDRAEYSHGASARLPGVRLPVLYPVLWELITWAKREGARWFDFGGVTPGSSDSSDPLGGISDFKRGFTKQEIVFGEEWVFEPSKAKARLARLASAAMEKLRS